MALYLEDLEDSVCQCGDGNCDNTDIFFNAKCHPQSATQASYTKGQGTLLVTCATCGLGVARIAVASKAAKN
jgi:hypothetical protein